MSVDFPEAIKVQARRLAFFRCCYSHLRPGDDVHHLLPKDEGGLGDLDNLTESIIGRFEGGSTSASDVVNVASTIISSLTPPTHYTQAGTDRSETPLVLRLSNEDKEST